MATKQNDLKKGESGIDGRKKKVLKAVIDSYIKEPVPVSSKKIAEKSFKEVSSATIRNDLATLEDKGYLAHTHVSSGRIPTDKGYRFFVDNFVDDTHRDARLNTTVATIAPSIENILQKTVQLVSAHTKLTAIALENKSKSRVISDLHLSQLENSQFVLGVFFDDASIESVTFNREDVKVAISDADLKEFFTHEIETFVRKFSVAIKGTNVSTLNIQSIEDKYFESKVNHEIAVFFIELLNSKIKNDVEETNIFLSGTQMIAKNPAPNFYGDSSEISSHLLALIEQHMQLAEIVQQSLQTNVSAKIGSENIVEEMAHHSMVLAPYTISNNTSGAIGIIGPTRMDYQQIFACLSVASESVENKMEK